jgi:hypothetical protein
MATFSKARTMGSLLATISLCISTIAAQGIQFANVPETVAEGTENLVISLSGIAPGAVRASRQFTEKYANLIVSRITYS